MQLLYCAFLLAVAFPYTQVLPLESYNQPYALLLGTVILCLKYRSTLRVMPYSDCWALTALVVLGVVMFLVTCFPYTEPQELKYLLNYLTPFVLTFAVLATVRAVPKLAYKVLAASALVWFFVGCVQTAIDPTFMTWTVGSWADVAEDVVSSGRGVLGLAPEPTHHGFHMIIMGATLALLGRSIWPPLLCVAAAVLLARSSSALLTLMLGGLVLAILRPSRRLYIVVFSGLATVLIFGAAALVMLEQAWLLEDNRIYSLATAFLESPSELLMLDYSVNMRIGGALATFSNAFDSFLLPNGMSHDHWLATGEVFLDKYHWLLDISDVGPPSGLGVIVFQAGFLAIPVLLIPLVRVLRLPVSGIPAGIVFASLFVFLGQYYISSPGFGLLYGCAIYKALTVYSGATRFAPRPGSPSEAPSHAIT